VTQPPVDPEWWRTLFDEVYLQTDARSVMDADLTRREVDALIRHLDLRPPEVVLDLCGGHGRHARELARRGFASVLVLDYSSPLLFLGQSQAREADLPVAFLRGDARALPLGEACCDAVALLANSFGYGATPEDDRLILGEARRVLAEAGRLFLEVADPEYVRRGLAPQSWHEGPEGLVVCRRRWVTAEYLVCRELVLSRTRGLVRDRTYRMRLYHPETLRACLEEAGFSRIIAVDPAADPPGGAVTDRGSLSRRLAVVAWK
jgi:D-alanine-D-alanine ligase